MASSVDLSRLSVFLAVADAGGFTAAAERLGVAKAMVSQQISRLEAEVGVALFTRTTRRVALTDAGQRLHERAAPLLRELVSVVDEVGSKDKDLTGTLRLTSSDDYVKAVLGEQLARFSATHPRLTIDLVTGDEVLDLISEGIDVAIRTGWLRDSSMHAVKLRDVDQHVVAAPQLLDRLGVPAKPADLERLPWIALTRLRSPLTWHFECGAQKATVRFSSRLRANSTAAVVALAQAGAGATVLADYMVTTAVLEGSLIRLLSKWRLPMGGVYAAYPATRHVPARVRALIDFLRQ